MLGTGVLRDIGQGLADDEVGDGLGRRVEPADVPDLDGDGHGGAGGQGGQCRLEATVGEDRRDDAAGDVPHLDDRLLGGAVRLVDELGGGIRVAVDGLLGHAEGHRDRDHPLLRSVVQVALDPSPLGLHGVDGLAARLAQGVDPGRQVLDDLALVAAEEPAGEHDVDRGDEVRQERHDEQGDERDRPGRRELRRALDAQPAEERVAPIGQAAAEQGCAEDEQGLRQPDEHEPPGHRPPHRVQHEVGGAAPRVLVEEEPAPQRLHPAGRRVDAAAGEGDDAVPLGVSDDPAQPHERHEEEQTEPTGADEQHGREDERDEDHGPDRGERARDEQQDAAPPGQPAAREARALQ
ncbi:hypothetical protein ON003_10060 [Janibacter hoylei]|nr:hypothetical protein [Janibacter hoylei]MCW4601908.1 hypothetical protein [Janibacter hoylei]